MVAHKITERQHEDGEGGQLPLIARENLSHLRHHCAEQKNHDEQGNEADDGGIQGGTQELGFEGLLILQIVGQLPQHGT